MSARESSSFLTRAEAAARIVTPGAWSAAHANGTASPPGLEPEPVDRLLFRRITSVDTFVNRSCVACGCHAALFISAGLFVVLCPSCTARRIAEHRRGDGRPEPGWIGILEREALAEVARQGRQEESKYTVTLDDLWKCARCGALIRAGETRYYFAPGQVSSPPYCEPCAETLGEEEGSGS
jgi:hypothetical protein